MNNANEWFEIKFMLYFEREMKNGGYIKTWVATVNSVGSGVVSVTLPNDTTNIIPDIKNPYGFSLNIGDTVELHSRLGSLGSCYVGMKY